MGGTVLSPSSGESPSVSMAGPWLLCPPHSNAPVGHPRGLLLSEAPVVLRDPVAQPQSQIQSQLHFLSRGLLIYSNLSHGLSLPLWMGTKV